MVYKSKIYALLRVAIVKDLHLWPQILINILDELCGISTNDINIESQMIHLVIT